MPYQGRQPGVGVRNRFIFIATSGQTSFSGADSNGLTLKYPDATYTDVFLNGALLIPVTDYAATNNTSVVLSSGAVTSDVVEIVAYDISSMSNTVPVTGGTFTGPVTVDGTLDVTGTAFTLSSTAPTFYLAETDTSNQHRIIATGGSLYIQAADSDGTTDGDLHLTGYTNADLNLLNIKAVTTAMNGNIAATGSVTAGDVFITGPTPVLTLTDDDTASEYTKIENSSGATFITSRNGAGNGAIILSGQGGGVTDEYARFISSGNFGIGDTSPSEALSVTGNIRATGDVTANDVFIVGPNPELRLTDTDGTQEYTIIANINGSTRIDSRDGAANGTIVFRGFGGGVLDEYARFDTTGNLLVGKGAANTTTEGVWIDGPNGRMFATADDDYTAQFTRNGSDGPLIYLYNDTAQAGLISVSGSSTTYGTSSDYRLKTDAQPMTGASARVQALNPVNFEWISDGTRVDGFLAHEAQAVVPECATGTKDAMKDEEYEVTPAVLDDDGNETSPAVMGTRSVPDYQGIDQSKIVPLLTAALQEALTKIDALEAQNATFETRLTALEA